ARFLRARSASSAPPRKRSMRACRATSWSKSPPPQTRRDSKDRDLVILPLQRAFVWRVRLGGPASGAPSRSHAACCFCRSRFAGDAKSFSLQSFSRSSPVASPVAPVPAVVRAAPEVPGVGAEARLQAPTPFPSPSPPTASRTPQTWSSPSTDRAPHSHFTSFTCFTSFTPSLLSLL